MQGDYMTQANTSPKPANLNDSIYSNKNKNINGSIDYYQTSNNKFFKKRNENNKASAPPISKYLP